MKNHFNELKENIKTKDFWKKEVKKISLSDILIWIAIFLMFMASWNNIQAGKDPCSYCIVRNDPIKGDVNCKEYFSSEINLGYIVGDNENIKDYDFGKTP